MDLAISVSSRSRARSSTEGSACTRDIDWARVWVFDFFGRIADEESREVKMKDKKAKDIPG